MGKYDNLSEYLNESELENIVLKFSDLEGILGFKLPDSARDHRPWWANTESHSYASSWMDAGWKVDKVDMAGEKVRFVKESVATKSRIFKKQPDPKHATRKASITAHEFEDRARQAVSEKFAVPFRERSVEGVHKRFDMVSSDGKYIGDAKFYTMVRGKNLPPAKFSVIAEHVWLLENTDAEHKFLVFGNDRRVPEEWLKRYGNLVKDVKFYFLDHESWQLIELN